MNGDMRDTIQRQRGNFVAQGCLNVNAAKGMDNQDQQSTAVVHLTQRGTVVEYSILWLKIAKILKERVTVPLTFAMPLLRKALIYPHQHHIQHLFYQFNLNPLVQLPQDLKDALLLNPTGVNLSGQLGDSISNPLKIIHVDRL